MDLNKELVIANKRLTHLLNKEIKKNEELRKEYDKIALDNKIMNSDYYAKIDRSYYLSEQIKRLDEQVKIMFAEKNVLLRKLGIPVQEDNKNEK